MSERTTTIAFNSVDALAPRVIEPPTPPTTTTSTQLLLNQVEKPKPSKKKKNVPTVKSSEPPSKSRKVTPQKSKTSKTQSQKEAKKQVATNQRPTPVQEVIPKQMSSNHKSDPVPPVELSLKFKEKTIFQLNTSHFIDLAHGESELMSFCKSQGYSYKINLDEIPPRSPHAEDAIIREIAMAYLFEKLARTNPNVKILDYFSSNRSITIARKVNARLKSNIRILCHRPIITQADSSRASAEHYDTSEEADVVMAVDIYKPSKECFRDFCGTKPLYVISHKHRGIQGRQGINGSWFRSRECDEIHLYQDSLSEGYVHNIPWYDQDDGEQEVLWTTKHVHGTQYCIRKVSFYGKSTKSIVGVGTMKVGPWMWWSLKLEGHDVPRTCYFDHAIVSSVSRLFAGRDSNLMTYASVQREVSNQFDKRNDFLAKTDSDLLAFFVQCTTIRVLNGIAMSSALKNLVIGKILMFVPAAHRRTVLILLVAAVPSLILLYKDPVRFFRIFLPFLKYLVVNTTQALWSKTLFPMLIAGLTYFRKEIMSQIIKVFTKTRPSYSDALQQTKYGEDWVHLNHIYAGGRVPRRERDIPLSNKKLKDMSLLTFPLGCFEHTTNWVKSNIGYPRGHDSFYCLWGLAVPWFCYQDSPEVRLAMLQRAMQKPPLSPKVQAEKWQKIFEFGEDLIDEHPVIVLEQKNVEAWISTKNPKQQHNYRFAMENPRHKDTGPIELFPKTDEFTLKRPRMICNVGPHIQVAAGPALHEVMERFKLRCQTPFCYQGLSFTLTVGSGRNDVELGDWANSLVDRENTFDIMAAGDDVIARVIKNNEVSWICSDFSLYDQSQSFYEDGGPLQFSMTLMMVLGLPAEVAKALLEQYVRKFKCTFPVRESRTEANVIYDAEAWPMLPTGMPTTTISNTMITLMSTAYVFWKLIHTPTFKVVDLGEEEEEEVTLEQEVLAIQRRQLNEENLMTEYLDLGLEAKIKIFARLSQADFLKGHFMQRKADGKWRWAKGLGMVSKLGRSKTDPRRFGRLDVGTTVLDHDQSFLAQCAAGEREFIQVPILRTFVTLFNYKQAKPRKNQEFWKVGSGGESELFDDYVSTDYLDYYGITMLQLRILEAELLVLPVGFILDSPCLSLVSKDYM
jgi:hypothetical protein